MCAIFYLYDSLQLSAQKKESGELSILLQVGLPVNLLAQMDIYAYHLQHPELSHLRISLELNVSQATVQRAIAFMRQELS